MKKDRQAGKFSQALKWVGYLTAIFSLSATVVGVAKYLYSRAETRKNLAALLATETEQQKSHDYSSAWQTLEKAAKHQGSGRCQARTPSGGFARARRLGLFPRITRGTT